MMREADVSARIVHMGAFAARFLALHGTATVAAVFEHSIYIEAGANFLCLGGAGIGEGPINAVVEADAGNGWIAGFRVGQPVAIRAGAIEAARCRVGFSTATCWRPRAWPAVASAGMLRAALACVGANAAGRIVADGLAPLVLRGQNPAGNATPFTRIAVPRVAKLALWLADCIAVRNPDQLPPTDLLGLGPGLTPSGDDALCGVMIALDAVGASGVRAALAASVLREAANATTPLSSQFLAAAAQGHGSAALHDFVAALIAADIAALPATIRALGRIGHTSGWDALAGAYLAINALAQADPPTQSP